MQGSLHFQEINVRSMGKNVAVVGIEPDLDCKFDRLTLKRVNMQKKEDQLSQFPSEMLFFCSPTLLKSTRNAGKKIRASTRLKTEQSAAAAEGARLKGATAACEGYLRHHAVCTCVLLILEDDVRVVVGGELLEALGVPGYFPFISAAGPQSLLGYVGAELLVGERNQFPLWSPLAVTSTRSAALTDRRE